jgi:hypothetical protein
VRTGTSLPRGIDAGPDGNLWFTENNTDKVAKIDTSGNVTEFSAGITLGGAPEGIAAGPDGSLWFTEFGGSRIGRITPATGSVTEFSAGVSPNSNPEAIVPGPDGNLWFTEAADRIGRITTAGAVTEFSTGVTTGSRPWGIAAGPDSNLWFAEFGGDRVGQITPADPPQALTGPSSAIGLTAATLSGTANAHDATTTVHFEYGTTTAYGSSTPLETVNGGAQVSLSASLTGLESATTYHYRLVAVNARGTTHGADAVFTTATPPPPPPPPLPPPPPAQVAILTDAASVSLRGATTLLLECGSGAGDCAGTLELTADVQVPIAHSHRSRSETVKLATARFSIGPGGRAPITLTLTAAGRAALAKAGHQRLSTKAQATTSVNTATRDVVLSTVLPPRIVTPTPEFTIVFHATFSTVSQLTPKGIPNGGAVEVRCHGGGCPFSVRRPKLRSGQHRIALAGLFGTAELRVGTRLEVRVTKPGAIGQIDIFTIEASAAPQVSRLCVPLGSNAPKRHC